MKISSVIISRNDNYGGNLAERATYCLNSAIDTYDEVFYIDWNSSTHSLLYDIRDNIKFKGNLKHIIITPEIASILTNNDPYAQVCCETLARNIGLRRATGDWIVSTNIDVIQPRRDHLENLIKNIDYNTFYTVSRRYVNWDMIKEFHKGKIEFNEWKELRDHLIKNSEERHWEEKVNENDDYSIINCCGDFQLAHRDVFYKIKGYEENMCYKCFTDTNIQKKAVLNGFGLKVEYDLPIYHMSHENMLPQSHTTKIHKAADKKPPRYNDAYEWVECFTTSKNEDNWGLGDTEIEFEIF
jgi:hypothetical protein